MECKRSENGYIDQAASCATHKSLPCECKLLNCHHSRFCLFIRGYRGLACLRTIFKVQKLKITINNMLWSIKMLKMSCYT